MTATINTAAELVARLNEWQTEHDSAAATDEYDGGSNYWDVVEQASPDLLDVLDWASDYYGDVLLADGTIVEYLGDRGNGGEWVHTTAPSGRGR